MTTAPTWLRRLAIPAIAVVLSVGVAGPEAARAQSIGYTFTSIAQTTGAGTFVEFFSPVLVNDGRVFFVAETGTGERVLLSGSGGGLTTVIDGSLPGLTFFQDAIWDVNNAGTVAFFGMVNGEQNVFTTPSLTPINDLADPNRVENLGTTAISDSGQVVIHDSRRIARGDGGPLTLLLDVDVDPTTLPCCFGGVAMNTSNAVAFLGLTLSGRAVYATSGGNDANLIGTLPIEGQAGQQNAPQINDAGVVAFYRRTAASGPGTRAIVIGTGGPLTTVVDNSGPFLDFGAPAINNIGTVAFVALTNFVPGSPTRIGVFTGPDPIDDRVIRSGDPLFGSTVESVRGATFGESLLYGQGRPGLNSSGQLAFLARLADGRQVVVRANPGAAPNDPPAVMNPGNQTATRGQAITPLQIQATDPDGDPLTYRASGLPPGLTINAATGLITGTPGPASAGNWSTTINVSDGRAATLISFAWTVIATATPVVQFDRAAYAVGEAAGSATITVTRTGSTTNALTVQYATSAGTATAGTDYTQRSGTLTVGAGQTSATFTVPIINDALVEGPETVNLALSNPSGATLGMPNTAVLTITDGASGGSLRFSAATYTAPEPPGPPGANLGFVTITVVRDGPTSNSVTVDYATGNGTATAGADHAAVSGTLTIPAGQRTRTFSVVLFHDTLVEGPETVSLALSNPTGGAVLGSPSTAVLTIADNDVGGTFRFSLAAYAVRENAGPATIKVLRSGGSASGVTVQYATSNGTAQAGTDYTATSGTLTFGAGQTELTFAVPIIDNGLADGNRVFNLALTAPGGATLGNPTTARLTIVDNEVGLRLSTAAYTVGEAGPTATIRVVRTGPTTPAVTVQYATSDGTATAGQDYTAVAGTLTFPAGVTSRTFLVPIVTDALVEGAETVNLVLSNPTGGGVIGTPGSAVLTITDNDAGGVVQFSQPAFAGAEPVGPAPRALLITVTRVVPVGRTPAAITVDYATSDGTATAGSDYTATSGTLTFAVNQLTRTFTVPIVHDTVDEPGLPETFTLTLSNPTGGATLGPRSTATGTIADNDVAGTVGFSAATYAVAENGMTQATITVMRSGGAASNVTVQYATSNGTAVAGTDYTATTGTLTFGAGETAKTFTVPILDNAIADGNRVITLGLSSPGGGGRLGARSTARLTIVDNEVGVRFSRAAYTVGEARPSATITVVRTGPATPVVTVQYATGDGTATGGQDYRATAGTLTFPAGVTSRTFLVPIVNDALVEGPETVNLALSSPTGGAVLGMPSAAALTINDDDTAGVFQFGAATYMVAEPVDANIPRTITITVTRTVAVGTAAAAASVDYATSNGTATAGDDYTATFGTLAFAVGQLSRTFTVTVVHDTTDEPPETVNLTLSNPTAGGTLGARGTAVLTIVDND